MWFAWVATAFCKSSDKKWDSWLKWWTGYQLRFLAMGNCPPTPSLSHNVALSEKKVLMLT